MGKRGHGEGTIRKRADGRWEGMLTVRDALGRPKRKSIYGKTYREVREKLTALRRDQDQGLPLISDRQTVGQFLDRWLDDSVKPATRPKTYASYADIVRRHIAPALGHHLLTKLEPQHVQALLRAKSEAGLSPRTVQYIRAVLRVALNKAQRWGLVSRNVAALVDPPRGKRPEVRPLAPEQARRLLDAARGDRLEALYSVALALGLRQGEALGLRWEDVDLDAGALRVRKQLQRIGGRLQLVDPKTERSRRAIDLPPIAVAALRAHRARQIEERLLAGPRWRGEEWCLVFPSTIGTPLEARNLVRAFKALLKRAGLPDIRFHDLRHTCASLLLAQGVPPRMVMETLGHSQIAMTMDTYSHIMPAMRREAADRMEAMLAGD